MGKLIPITISGIVFQVEPEAYERLAEYLSEIRKHYFQQQNHSLILEIEAVILEFLNNKTENRTNSIKYLDVLDLIQTMGHVSESPFPPKPLRVDLEIDGTESTPIYDQEYQSKSTTKRNFGRADRNRKIAGVAEGIGLYLRIDPVFIRLLFIVLLSYKGVAILIYLLLIVVMPHRQGEEHSIFKRIMRDPDDKVLGGVAAGLARYLGIDPVLLRVFFIFSILLGGVGILIYTILWLAVSLAKTSEDKIAMRGRPISYYLEAMIRESNEGSKSTSGLTKWMAILLKNIEEAFNSLKTHKSLYGIIQIVFAGLIIYIFLKNVTGPSFNFNINDQYDAGFFNFDNWSTTKKISLSLLGGIPVLLIGIKIIESLINRKFDINLLKRGLLFIWLIVVLLVGFKGYLFSNSSQDGNGILSIKKYDIEDFSTIQVDGEFELDISKSERPSVEISTDENLSKFINVESSKGKLRIYSLDEFGDATQLSIKISAVNFDELILSGNSKVTVDSLRSPTFTIKVDGEGELRGKLFVENLLVNQSGSGRIYLQGTATHSTITSAGQMNLDAYNLETAVMKLQLDGEGTVKVNVTDDLDVHINGEYQVLYKGQPHISQNINGQGSVKMTD